MTQIGTSEEFKPIPIQRRDGSLGDLLFALRSILDLQLLTCLRFLRPHLSVMRGSVLDVGCGEMPFRGLLAPGCLYTGLDIPQADDFGMRRHSEIVDFDGRNIPFADDTFDHILCTEVLEHAEEPDQLIAEMHRVLRPGGTLAVTIPFSARVHHAPHDYRRFTSYCLARMFSNFDDVKVGERGDDLAVIANKLIVVCVRLGRPSASLIWRGPLFLVVAPAALVSLAIAHLSLWLDWGSKADPLGYGVTAKKA